MLRLTYVPRPPLSQFMHFLWLYEGYTQAHAKERALPTGQMQIVINLLEDKSCIYDRDNPDRCQTFNGSLLAGAHTEYIVIGTSMQAFIMGVAFKPGGAFPFLRMPAGELRDTTVSLDTLWGTAALDLRDQLLEAPTHQARFEVLERVLMGEFTRGFEPHGAIGFALRRFLAEPQVITIAEVTEQIGLTPKRLSRHSAMKPDSRPRCFAASAGFSSAARMEGRRASRGRTSRWIAATSIRRILSTISALSPASIPRLSGAPDAASQPCAVNGLIGGTEKGQIFTIRAASFGTE